MEQTTISNTNSLTAFLTEERVRLLVSGLQSLEGALNALQQPLPEGLGKLKQVLFLQRDILASSPVIHLTTAQVSLLLGCSTRRVRQLGRQGHIKLLQQGRRGRGRSNLYGAASVYEYGDRDKGAVEDS